LIYVGLGTSASQILFTLVSENGPIRHTTSRVDTLHPMWVNIFVRSFPNSKEIFGLSTQFYL